jgi:hypothetical protein
LVDGDIGSLEIGSLEIQLAGMEAADEVFD